MDGGHDATQRHIPRLLLLLPALLAAPAHAGEQAWEACFDDAGRRYGIAPALLRAIAAVESNLDPQAERRNQDGSRDIGLMQVNSRWLPHLARYGITAESLSSDVCLNIHVGAWILAQEIQRYGYGWEAVGAYHTGAGADARRRQRRARYALRVHRRLERAAAPGARRMRPDACPVRSGLGRDALADHRLPGCDPAGGRGLDPVSGLSRPDAKAPGTGG